MMSFDISTGDVSEKKNKLLKHIPKTYEHIEKNLKSNQNIG